MFLPAFLLSGKILLSFESYPRIEMKALYQILSNDKHLTNCGSLDGLLF